MSDLQTFANEAANGIFKGATSEIGKLIVNGVNRNIPWSQFLCTKKMLMPTLSIKSVPAISPTGKRTIHVELDVDVDEKAEAVGYQVQAFQLVAPPPLNQALGSFFLSLVMAVIWIQLWNKQKTVKSQDEKAIGIEKKTDSGVVHHQKPEQIEEVD